MSANPTIKTIAQAVGVTHGTVSRALKGDPRVNPETTRRILAAAEKLGYVRSRLAQGLRTSRSFTLGILLANLSDPFFSDVLRGVHDRVVPAGFHLMVGSAHRGDGDPLQGFLQQRVDGLFLGCVPQLSQAYRELMARSRPPLVLLNHSLGDFPHCVSNDEDRGIRECVAFLRACSYRRLAYLGNACGGSVNATRVASFRRAAGPTAEVRLASGGELAAGRQALREWPRTELPEALLCYNDLLAAGALRACREAGLRVPEDLAIMGFDDIELADYLEPPLTTFAQPRYELGRRAAQMMLELLDGQSVAGPVMLTGGLVVRRSISLG